MDRAKAMRPIDDVQRVMTYIRTAVEDEQTRQALRRTIDRGRDIYGNVATDGAKRSASRLARDEDLQTEIGAFVRSASDVFDAGLKANRRRRHLWTWIAALGALGAALYAWMTRHHHPDGGEMNGVAVHVHGTADQPATSPAG